MPNTHYIPYKTCIQLSTSYKAVIRAACCFESGYVTRQRVRDLQLLSQRSGPVQVRTTVLLVPWDGNQDERCPRGSGNRGV